MNKEMQPPGLVTHTQLLLLLLLLMAMANVF